MLHLAGEVFTKGGSRFEDNLPEGGEGSAKIFVKVIPGDLPVTIFAQLDTGAPWSIFDPEIAHALGPLAVVTRETVEQIAGLVEDDQFPADIEDLINAGVFR